MRYKDQYSSDVISQICQECALQHTSVSIVLGGSEVLLKRTNLPSKKYKEALSAIEWDETINSGGYKLFDAAYIGPSEDGCTHDWLIAAYSHNRIMTLLDAFQREHVIVKRIDVLPAVFGRFYPSACGTLYMQDGTGVHVCVLMNRIPGVYRWYEDMPEDVSEWIQENGTEQILKQPLLRVGDSEAAWVLPAVPPAFQEHIDRFHLTYPAAILTSVM